MYSSVVAIYTYYMCIYMYICDFIYVYKVTPVIKALNVFLCADLLINLGNAIGIRLQKDRSSKLHV